jgi:hypothetical protein
MMKAAQAWWKTHGTRAQTVVGLWLVSRLLNLIEWRFRIEAML